MKILHNRIEDRLEQNKYWHVCIFINWILPPCGTHARTRRNEAVCFGTFTVCPGRVCPIITLAGAGEGEGEGGVGVREREWRGTFFWGDTSCRWELCITVVTQRRAKCSLYPPLPPFSSMCVWEREIINTKIEEEGVRRTESRWCAVAYLRVCMCSHGKSLLWVEPWVIFSTHISTVNLTYRLILYDII